MYKDYEIVFDKETKQQRVFRYSRGGVIRNKTIAEIAPNRFIPCRADGTIFERVENKLNKMGFTVYKCFIPTLARESEILAVPGTNDQMQVVKAIVSQKAKADDIISIIPEDESTAAYPKGRTLVILNKKETNGHGLKDSFGLTFRLDPNDEDAEICSRDVENALAILADDEWNTLGLSNSFRISKGVDVREFKSEDEFYEFINASVKSLEHAIDKLEKLLEISKQADESVDESTSEAEEPVATEESDTIPEDVSENGTKETDTESESDKDEDESEPTLISYSKIYSFVESYNRRNNATSNIEKCIRNKRGKTCHEIFLTEYEQDPNKTLPNIIYPIRLTSCDGELVKSYGDIFNMNSIDNAVNRFFSANPNISKFKLNNTMIQPNDISMLEVPVRGDKCIARIQFKSSSGSMIFDSYELGVDFSKLSAASDAVTYMHVGYGIISLICSRMFEDKKCSFSRCKELLLSKFFTKFLSSWDDMEYYVEKSIPKSWLMLDKYDTSLCVPITLREMNTDIGEEPRKLEYSIWISFFRRYVPITPLREMNMNTETIVSFPFQYNQAKSPIKPSVSNNNSADFTLNDKLIVERNTDKNGIIPTGIHPVSIERSVDINTLKSAIPMNNDSLNITVIDSKIDSVFSDIDEGDINNKKYKLIHGDTSLMMNKIYMTNRVFPNCRYRARLTITADINTDYGILTVLHAVKMWVRNPKTHKLNDICVANNLVIDIDTTNLQESGYLSFMHLAYDIVKIIWDKICNPDPSDIVYVCGNCGGDTGIDTINYTYTAQHSIRTVQNHVLDKCDRFETNTVLYITDKQTGASEPDPTATPLGFKTTVTFERVNDNLNESETV